MIRLAAIEEELAELRRAITRADNAHAIAQGVRCVQRYTLEQERARLLRDAADEAERSVRLHARRVA